MNISIFGLGYVGIVTAACLAKEGHRIVGVDVSPIKVKLVNRGRSPIIEDKIGDLVCEAVAHGRLRAIGDAAAAVAETDLAIVCVGTPSRRDGALDQRYVKQVIAQIGAALRGRTTPFLVVVRSTIVPGTMRDLVLPTLARASGRPAGEGYEVAFHPEFLREGTSVDDFYAPPKIVVGERVPGAAEQIFSLYNGIAAPRVACSLDEAEMVKYCDNLFHALKVAFANEIGRFCRAHAVDSARVMGIFCQDEKLNISSKYLRPGFAFGGSCLPKDLRAFMQVARARKVVLPLLESVLVSNREHLERAVADILALGVRTVGLFGLAFKPGTDDLRESPLVQLTERLLERGVRVRIYDQHVRTALLMGRNQSYIAERLPHLARLLVKRPADLNKCGLVVIGHPPPPDLLAQWQKLGRRLYDLTGRPRAAGESGRASLV